MVFLLTIYFSFFTDSGNDAGGFFIIPLSFPAVDPREIQTSNRNGKQLNRYGEWDCAARPQREARRIK